MKAQIFQKEDKDVLQNFRSYQLALQLYRECRGLRVPAHLKDQLMRAASSVSLNLAEGSAKPTVKDRLKFYNIAFGSLREAQAIIELEHETLEVIRERADILGAHLYRLCRP